MQNATAEKICEAAKLIGIDKKASLRDIRTLYHEQLKIWHPDTSDKPLEESHNRTILLNEAYQLLVDYCMDYQFSFRLEDLKKPDGIHFKDRWMEQFGDDPIWG